MRYNIPAVLPEVINFGSEDYEYSWKIFGDEALGGKSKAQITQNDHTLKISGNIVNINNTAFACLRSESLEHDLSDVKFIDVEMRSDGRPYAFELEYNHGWHEDKLGYMIYDGSQEWQTVRIPMSAFSKIRFKQIVDSNYNPDVLKNIYRFGFYVSDGIEGPFEFELKSISFIY
ncbi:MAG: CIA30 family protein [Nonlabens sp.]|uniref:CIA30 family protein n=1 Tax=Nonlabens sp. TaxID=1888209 RepID=UPI003EFB05FB